MLLMCGRRDREGTNMKPKPRLQSTNESSVLFIALMTSIGDRPLVKDLEHHLLTLSAKPNISAHPTNVLSLL